MLRKSSKNQVEIFYLQKIILILKMEEKSLELLLDRLIKIKVELVSIKGNYLHSFQLKGKGKIVEVKFKRFRRF